MDRTAEVASEGNPAERGRAAPVEPQPRRRGRPRGSQTRLLSPWAGELGRHHFAFLRALIDGVGLEQAWKRYLAFSGGPNDRRHVVTRLRQLVEVIAVAGPQRGRPGEARLVAATLRALPDLVPERQRPGAGKAGRSSVPAEDPVPESPQAPSPALEEWRSEYCRRTGVDEDFYSEAEWLELYVDEFGEASLDRSAGAEEAGASTMAPSPALPATAHVRLADRVDAELKPRLNAPQRKAVLDALSGLEQVLAREPSLEDEVGFWLASGMPRELMKVGVKSLGDLVSFINLYGFRWHRRVGRMGVIRARRLLDWLVPLAAACGSPVRDASTRPETDLVLLRRQERQELAGAAGTARFALVPIVEGALPDALSGRIGTFRAPEANIWGAETDVQAIGQWLSRYRGQTLRDYTRIAERFYLWCTHVQRKALSSLQETDLQAYQAFLAAPPADWVQQRKVRREDPSWRPFRGPLGRNSQRHEFTVLGSMFSTMLEKGYLRANAMANMSRALGLVKPSIDVRRSFSERHWAFAKQVLLEKPDTSERRRLELLLELGSTTGLRLSELATARMQGLRLEHIDGEPAWLLDIVGKGGKVRTVVVLDHVKALIEQHHRDMDAAGLGFDATVDRVQIPASPATTAAGERAFGGSGHRAASTAAWQDTGLAETVAREARDAWRPLVGILRRPPPRRKLDHLGVAFVDRGTSTQADRYGALERSAIDKLLRRFFREAAEAAAARHGAPEATDFLAASTHWLRHTFANTAIKQMQPQVLQSLLGHSDLRVTSVYVKADATDLVRGVRAMKRAGADAVDREANSSRSAGVPKAP